MAVQAGGELLRKSKDLRAGAIFLAGVTKTSELQGILEAAGLAKLPRVAMIGRSNVGKSSVLNALTEQKKLARVSTAPGRTREFNLFLWRPSADKKRDVILVDLPGYGFAKVSKSLRQSWGNEISAWLADDGMLRFAVSIVDGYVGITAADEEFLGFARSIDLPLVVAFNKMDRWKSNSEFDSAKAKLKQFCETLGIGEYVFISAEQSNRRVSGVSSLRRIFEDLSR